MFHLIFLLPVLTLSKNKTNPSITGMDFVGLNISVVLLILRITLGIAEEGQCFSRYVKFDCFIRNHLDS